MISHAFAYLCVDRLAISNPLYRHFQANVWVGRHFNVLRGILISMLEPRIVNDSDKVVVE